MTKTKFEDWQKRWARRWTWVTHLSLPKKPQRKLPLRSSSSAWDVWISAVALKWHLITKIPWFLSCLSKSWACKIKRNSCLTSLWKRFQNFMKSFKRPKKSSMSIMKGRNRKLKKKKEKVIKSFKRKVLMSLKMLLSMTKL